MSQNNSAKFVFYYMLSLVALIFLALSTGMIFFQVINKYIIDTINQYSGYFSSNQLKYAISAVVISAPIYYLVTRLILKSIFKGDLNKDSEIRKWLSYLILFVSSVVMISWLIGTLNSFLEGELTLKFILKSLTAIGISATVFSFYFYEIKREVVEGNKDSIIKIYFYGSLAVVIIAFVLAILVVESPTMTRDRKLDESITRNFSNIDHALNNYYIDNQDIPESLNELLFGVIYLTQKEIEDPSTGEIIEYKKQDSKTYELCSTFKLSNKDTEGIYIPDKIWLHDAGYQCIAQKIRQDMYNKRIPGKELPISAR